MLPQATGSGVEKPLPDILMFFFDTWMVVDGNLTGNILVVFSSLRMRKVKSPSFQSFQWEKDTWKFAGCFGPLSILTP